MAISKNSCKLFLEIYFKSVWGDLGKMCNSMWSSATDNNCQPQRLDNCELLFGFALFLVYANHIVKKKKMMLPFHNHVYVAVHF